MEKIGVERISNGFVVFGTEFKTFRENLDLAEKEFRAEADNVVRVLKTEEAERRKNPGAK